tara:strand:- start:2462 stop:2992 length:531 start_codon:yes stop_codon:yes gene_type:complete
MAIFTNEIFPAGGETGNGGGIIQVVQIVKTDRSSTQSSTYSDIPGLTANITVQSGNKVLVYAELWIGDRGGYSSWVRLRRVNPNGSDTAPHLGNAYGSRTQASTGGYTDQNSYAQKMCSFMYLDTPSDYSGANSYRCQWLAGYNGYTSYIGQDYQGSDDSSRGLCPSTLTLFEVSS